MARVLFLVRSRKCTGAFLELAAEISFNSTYLVPPQGGA